MAARILRVVNLSLALMSGVVIAAIAISITINVILRSQGGAVYGIEEIVQMAMVPVIFLSIAYCGQIDAHITVDIAHPFLPGWLRAITDPLVRLAGALIFFALAYFAMHSAGEAALYGETTNLRRFPLAPIWWTLSIGAGLAGVIELFRFFPTLLPIRPGDDAE